MEIIVWGKQVPDTETRVRIGPDGRSIVETDVNWIASPYDEFAIEEALRIRDAKGGEGVLVTAGPERAQAPVRAGAGAGSRGSRAPRGCPGRRGGQRSRAPPASRGSWPPRKSRSVSWTPPPWV